MKHSIVIDSSFCSGCTLCQLVCSYTRTGAFNPSLSALAIKRVNRGERYSISLDKTCTSCGTCTKFCSYGALSRTTSNE